MSTIENGVFYFPNLNILHYSLGTPSKIRSLGVRKNQIYIGEYDGTVIRIDGPSKKLKQAKKFHSPVLSIFNDKRNTLWVSSNNLFTLDQQDHEILKSNTGTFRDISQDKDGNIWAIQPTLLSSFNEEGTLLRRNVKRTSVRNMVAIDSLLVIGTHTGLEVYNQNLNLIRSPRELENFKISFVRQLNDSTVLIATIGNGFFLSNKKFNQFYHFQLQARNIYSSLQDSSRLWLGTEKGIVIVPIESILKRKADFHLLTKRSGLLNDQVYFLARTGDEVFAFDENDFTVIPLHGKKFINQSPTFYVKNVKINNDVREYAETLDLPYDQNHIQIGFGFISYNHQDIQSRYRLDSKEPWNYTNERVINLYSLGPGTYTVELQYSTDRIHWKKAPLASTIHIAAPWWRTAWFLSFLFCVIILIIFLFARNRLKNQELRNTYQQRLLRLEIDASERERLRIAQELHDRVGTDLSAMKMIVGQLLQKNGHAQTSAIENNFQEMIREIKDIIYNLSPPGLERFGLFQTIKNYIEKLQPIAPPITLNTFGDDITNAQLGIAIFRVLQELLSNSLKYSLAQNITIHINSFQDLVNVVYEDDGKGFVPTPEKIGMGLQNIEARVRSLDGQITFESGTFGVSYSIDIPLTALKHD